MKKTGQECTEVETKFCIMSDANCVINDTKKHEIDYLSLTKLRMLKLIDGRNVRIVKDMYVIILSHY